MKAENLELPLEPKDLATIEFDAWRRTPRGGEIANLFIRLSLQMKRRGWDHYSAQAIIEAIRWHHHLKHGPGSDGFKVSHNWRRPLSAWAMQRAPVLTGFFRLRKQSENEGEKLP